MSERRSWIERTLETVVLPALQPVADVRTAGSTRCHCRHTMLGHAGGAGACRSCTCGGFDPDVTTAA